jgi:hypothetical protein
MRAHSSPEPPHVRRRRPPFVVTGYLGGLWQLLRLLTICNPREEHRQTLKVGVSIGVPGRIVFGPIAAL